MLNTFYQRGASSSKFLNYLNKDVLPVIDKVGLRSGSPHEYMYLYINLTNFLLEIF